MKLILAIGFVLSVAALIVAMVSSAPGFGDCGQFGYGWAPTWVNGLPDCTYMGVYEGGCCYRADGNDTLGLLMIGGIILVVLALPLALAFPWLEGRWMRRQLGINRNDLW